MALVALASEKNSVGLWLSWEDRRLLSIICGLRLQGYGYQRIARFLQEKGWFRGKKLRTLAKWVERYLKRWMDRLDVSSVEELYNLIIRSRPRAINKCRISNATNPSTTESKWLKPWVEPIVAARRLGRTPILSPRLAYLIDRLKEAGSKIALPSLKDTCIYFERRSLRGGGYDLSPRHYRRWMREVYESRLDGRREGELRKAEEISKDQGKYILIANSLDYVLELAQIKPEPGSRLIVSTSEPHDEEQEISWGKFLEWVDLLRLDMRMAHSSGHADRESLLRIIEEIDPKAIIPIHTERPYEFQRLKRIGDIRCEVILPHVSRSLTLK